MHTGGAEGSRVWRSLSHESLIAGIGTRFLAQMQLRIRMGPAALPRSGLAAGHGAQERQPDAPTAVLCASVRPCGAAGAAEARAAAQAHRFFSQLKELGAKRTGIEDRKLDMHITFCAQTHQAALKHVEQVPRGPTAGRT